MFLIEEYIEGELLYDEMNKNNFDQNIMFSVGKKLAELHKFLIKDVWQDKNKINNKEEWISSVEKRNKSNLQDLEKNKIVSSNQINFLKEYLNNFLNKLKNGKVLLCPIHGDYSPKNVLIRGLEVKGIFDFEIHRIAHNLNDLGIVYYWYKFHDKEKLFLSLLEGYSKIIEVTENEKELIKAYYIMQVIGAISFLIKENIDKKALIKLKRLLSEFFEQNKNHPEN